MEHMKYVVIESKCHYGIVVIQASRLLKKKKNAFERCFRIVEREGRVSIQIFKRMFPWL